MTLDAWAQASNVYFSTCHYGDMALIKMKGRQFHLLKPSTFMNLSGNAVRYWMQKEEIPMENLLVICDDLNLPFGTLRLRKAGSDGGHNGLKNIQELLGTQSFARLRLGVGHDFSEGGQVDYVLGNIGEDQAKQLEGTFKTIQEGIGIWAFSGIERAMTFLNTKAQDK